MSINEFSGYDDFPILSQLNRGKKLVYLDSGATSQKPKHVIEAVTQFYREDYANIHRGVYELSERSTQRYDRVRNQVSNLINAKTLSEIVFTKGCTESINLIATTLSQSADWQADDEIILSEMEHHANIVPWMMLKDRLGIKIKVISVTDEGELDLAQYETLFSPKTRLVSVTHVSNVLGTINPVKAITQIARAHDVPVLIDGAQAIAHIPVDVQSIGCDFYALSSHKCYGPTGVGVLYAKDNWLERLPPYQGGGDMIETVSFEKVTFAKSPQKFEAGTPNLAGVIGLGAAIEYLQSVGYETIQSHENALLLYATSILKAVSGLRLIGTSAHKIGILSFELDHVHAHDLATILDHEGVAVRAGHHCAMPLMKRFGVSALTRASMSLFTTKEDIDALVEGITIAKRMLG